MCSLIPESRICNGKDKKEEALSSLLAFPRSCNQLEDELQGQLYRARIARKVLEAEAEAHLDGTRRCLATDPTERTKAARITETWIIVGPLIVVEHVGEDSL